MPSYAPGFFYYDFDWVKVGDGRAFATGYYEPEIAGLADAAAGLCRRSTACRPTSSAAPGLTAPPAAAGSTRPAPASSITRAAEIDQGALNGKGLEIAWAKDPVELFFAEIQGSALVRFDDGTIMQIGYAGQNGRDYVGDRAAAARPRHPAAGRRQTCRRSRTGSAPIPIRAAS